MSEGANFVLLAAQLVTVLSAMAVAFHPNILHAAVALLFAFLGVSVMFLYAGADFLAGAQIVIYVGGITILILFAIMLTHWLYQVKLRDLRLKMLVPLVLVFAGLLPFVYKALANISDTIAKAPAEEIAKFSSSPKTKLMGEALLNTYLLPFEAITILLLGALVGAVWLARPDKS